MRNNNRVIKVSLLTPRDTPTMPLESELRPGIVIEKANREQCHERGKQRHPRSAVIALRCAQNTHRSNRAKDYRRDQQQQPNDPQLRRRRQQNIVNVVPAQVEGCLREIIAGTPGKIANPDAEDRALTDRAQR